MSTKSYADQLLEVATELELTGGGDFMKVIILKVSRPWDWPSAVAGYAMGPYNIKRSVEGKVFWHDHWETTLTIYLDVGAVLHGRDVRPEDVVALFGPDASGNRIVSLVDGREVTAVVLNDCQSNRRYFRLTQIEVCDRRFFERLKAWGDALAIQAKRPELHEELQKRLRVGLELPKWARPNAASAEGGQV